MRTVLDGARTVLEHAGMPPSMWSHAVRHICFAHNVVEQDGGSPWEKRHGRAFTGPLLPFGCLVDFLPSPVRGEERHKFQSRAVAGLMLGYHLQPGRRWNHEFVVATTDAFRVPLEDLTWRISTQRVREVIVDKNNSFVFPLRARHEEARGDLRPPDEVPGPVPLTWDVPPAPEPGPVAAPDAGGDVPAGDSHSSVVGGGAVEAPPISGTDPAGTVEVPPGYELYHGMLVRSRKGSSRPPDIHPDVWRQLTYGKRLRLAKEYKEKLEAQAKGTGAGAPGDPPKKGGCIEFFVLFIVIVLVFVTRRPARCCCAGGEPPGPSALAP